MPFLAVNKGHGTNALLSTARHGISIYVRAFDEIEIATDGNSARLGGGTYVDQSIRAFAARGKVGGQQTMSCLSRCSNADQ